ncbi:MAG: large subunit ribosomal protein L23 [Candidatus Saganbacteria bacterium]|uniref:Large ribosomal subunit protein uL23 n=1 Tax=Candidatus Saganbacteria bacterium TaxID=2575572 RepID=A0A833L3R6_UNCSA|nr:MAG: large subunit ribosomal protein L23 [Candidatus Saganbacteria bacterium]
MKSEHVLIEPIITEKAVSAKAQGRYVFKVHREATKIQIKNAVSKAFKVKVADVNTTIKKGKIKMAGWRADRMPSYKKAYVTLASGQKIEELEI